MWTGEFSSNAIHLWLKIGIRTRIQSKVAEGRRSALSQERRFCAAVAEGHARRVRMQSHVRFRDESTGQVRDVQLVYPGEADPAHGRISILTPVGTALIGLTEGQSIRWKDRGGKNKCLTVLNVRDLPGNWA
jgi:transcription elongation GreA/GreB family factor